MIMSKQGQSILEYAVMLACVIAALVGMQIYVKRGISGGLRNSADMIGKQYDPAFISSSITTTVTGDYFTKVETLPLDSDGDGENDTSVSETYTVVGPDEMRRFDSRFGDPPEGIVVIPADDSRRAEETTAIGRETVSRD